MAANPIPRATSLSGHNYSAPSRTITTPLAGTDVAMVELVVTMSNGATYTVSLDAPMIDMQYDQEVHPVTAFGSQGPVAHALGQTRVDVRLQGYARQNSGVYEEPTIPEIPKFASPEDAQAWLDRNSA